MTYCVQKRKARSSVLAAAEIESESPEADEYDTGASYLGKPKVTYIHTYIHAYIHTYIHTCIHT